MICVLVLAMSTVCTPFLMVKLNKITIDGHVHPITWTGCLPAKIISNIKFERGDKELFNDTKIILVL